MTAGEFYSDNTPTGDYTNFYEIGRVLQKATLQYHKTSIGKFTIIFSVIWLLCVIFGIVPWALGVTFIQIIPSYHIIAPNSQLFPCTLTSVFSSSTTPTSLSFTSKEFGYGEWIGCPSYLNSSYPIFLKQTYQCYISTSDPSQNWILSEWYDPLHSSWISYLFIESFAYLFLTFFLFLILYFYLLSYLPFHYWKNRKNFEKWKEVEDETETKLNVEREIFEVDENGSKVGFNKWYLNLLFAPSILFFQNYIQNYTNIRTNASSLLKMQSKTEIKSNFNWNGFDNTENFQEVKKRKIEEFALLFPIAKLTDRQKEILQPEIHHQSNSFISSLQLETKKGEIESEISRLKKFRKNLLEIQKNSIDHFGELEIIKEVDEYEIEDDDQIRKLKKDLENIKLQMDPSHNVLEFTSRERLIDLIKKSDEARDRHQIKPVNFPRDGEVEIVEHLIAATRFSILEYEKKLEKGQKNSRLSVGIAYGVIVPLYMLFIFSVLIFVLLPAFVGQITPFFNIGDFLAISFITYFIELVLAFIISLPVTFAQSYKSLKEGNCDILVFTDRRLIYCSSDNVIKSRTKTPSYKVEVKAPVYSVQNPDVLIRAPQLVYGDLNINSDPDNIVQTTNIISDWIYT